MRLYFTFGYGWDTYYRGYKERAILRTRGRVPSPYLLDREFVFIQQTHDNSPLSETTVTISTLNNQALAIGMSIWMADISSCRVFHLNVYLGLLDSVLSCSTILPIYSAISANFSTTQALAESGTAKIIVRLTQLSDQMKHPLLTDGRFLCFFFITK